MVAATVAVEEVTRTTEPEAHGLAGVEDFTALGLAVGGLLLLLVHLRRGVHVVAAAVAMEEVARRRQSRSAWALAQQDTQRRQRRPAQAQSRRGWRRRRRG